MDGSDPAENYRKIRRELEAFSPALAEKREIIAANKMDLAIDNDAIDHLRRELPGKQIFPISGVSRQGVEDLLEVLWKILQEIKPVPQPDAMYFGGGNYSIAASAIAATWLAARSAAAPDDLGSRSSKAPIHFLPGGRLPSPASASLPPTTAACRCRP